MRYSPDFPNHSPRRWTARLKTALVLCLLAVVTVAGLSGSTRPSLDIAPRSAEAHDRGDFLPAIPTWVMERVQQRGYGIYRLDPRADQWPALRAAIWRCYADEYAKTGILFMEDWTVGASESDVDLLYTMPDSFPYEQGVVGVAYYANAPAFIQLNFRAGVTVWDSTVCHEHGHIDGQEDLYIHPLVCDASRARIQPTRMSCGTFIGDVRDYDRDMVWNVYIPDLPSRVNAWRSSPSQVTVQYNGIRKSSEGCIVFAGQANVYPPTQKDNYCGHYSPYLDNATRVAIFFQYPGQTEWYWWAYGPAPTNGNVWTSAVLDCPYGCDGIRVALHPESAIEATWLGRVNFLSGNLAVLEP